MVSEVAAIEDAPTIETAARQLWTDYAQRTWFTSVGISADRVGPLLILYISQSSVEATALARSGWRGFRVKVERMTRPKPL